jgi:hypothetical protein
MKREIAGKPKASEKATTAAKKESKEPDQQKRPLTVIHPYPCVFLAKSRQKQCLRRQPCRKKTISRITLHQHHHRIFKTCRYYSEERTKQEVREAHKKKETSQQAKDMLRDAHAARTAYDD